MTGEAFAVRIRLFGLHREIAGVSALEVELSHGCTVRDLRAALTGHPSIGALLAGVAVAVNRAYAFEDDVVSEGDEVAIIPPVAGG